MIPQTDERSLSRYLMSAAKAIRHELVDGLAGNAEARLRECAAIVLRVAQQIEAGGQVAADAAAEYDAMIAAEHAFDDPSAQATPALTPRSIDGERMEAYLRRHPIGGGDLRVTDARLLAGGRCKVTARIGQSGGERLPAVFILRQDWEGGATQTTVAGEFALLQTLVAHGVRVPAPLHLETDPAVLGAPFMLMEHIDGHVAGALFDPPRSPVLMFQLAEQLGRTHGIPADALRDLFPASSEQAIDRATALKEFRASHARIGLRSRIVDAALDWLGDHLDAAGSEICLVHNDVGFHNALSHGEELTAVLDWELAELGHPASDLGYIKHFVEKVVPWEAFIDRYVTAGGFVINPVTVRFHAIWNAIRLYGLIMHARDNLAAGKVDDIEITYACADNVMPLIRFIGRELGLEDGRAIAVAQ